MESLFVGMPLAQGLLTTTILCLVWDTSSTSTVTSQRSRVDDAQEEAREAREEAH